MTTKSNISFIKIHLGICTDKKENLNYIDSKLEINGNIIVDKNKDVFPINFIHFLTKSKNHKSEYTTSKEYSNFYPLSCECGEPGCNGIEDGIYSYHKKNIVKWKIKDPVSRKALGTKYLSFYLEQYEKEIDSILTFLKENKNVIIDIYGEPLKIKDYYKNIFKYFSI